MKRLTSQTQQCTTVPEPLLLPEEKTHTLHAPMAQPKRGLRHDDYTVAWLCALPIEMAAAEAMLDERHPDLPISSSDRNTYTLGRVHIHNIVISCLPSGVYGTVSAASLAAGLQSTFPSIRFGLMVGIGGGVPGPPTNIQLGDVVVSKPTREFGGVVQYEFGKIEAGKQFVRTGMLNKPPTVLLTAISKLQATHLLRGSLVPDIVTQTLTRNPSMSDTFKPPDQQARGADRYSDATMIFPKACGIHYGLIASGNKVVKDNKIRDQLAKDYGILCFEMEAAGLMDNFPCLVIRGISDYADVSKNKGWQGYASLTSCAFTKELLSVIQGSPIVEPTNHTWGVALNLQKIGRLRSYKDWIAPQESNKLKTLFERITRYDHERVHQRLLRKKLVGTTRWFLDHPSFRQWFSEKAYPFLWCTGKIGSGKTILATSVIEEARRCTSTESRPTVFFYCDETSDSRRRSTVLSSFIKQLLEFWRRTYSSVPSDTQEILWCHFGPKGRTPDVEDLQEIFTRLFYLIPGAIYVLDGLDALEKSDAKCLLTFLQSLLRGFKQPPRTSQILFLSREYLAGNMRIDMFFPCVTQISTSDNVMHDIRIYIEDSIADKMLRKRLTADSSLLNEMKSTLLLESSGVFLWVYLQIEIIWDTCVTDAEIRHALRTLPKGLEETYSRCLGRMNLHDPRTVRAIIWVRFAARPLRSEELQEAVAFDATDRTWDPTKIPLVDFVVGSCANLLVLDPDDYVCFAHSSINQFVDKARQSIPGFPDCFESGDRYCGELCISYLCFSEFRLWLEKEREMTSRITVPYLPSLAAGSVGQNIYRWLFAESTSREMSLSFPFRSTRTACVPPRGRYKFLDYAINHWAPHTKYIQTGGVFWERFTRLALTYNETWNIHPWSSGGQSQLSHLHDLFGWAVCNHHSPLLLLALQFEDGLRRVCDLPLVHLHLPALHIACKRGDEGVVKKLMAFCDVNKIALEGLGPLHYAAAKGYTKVVDALLDAPGIDIDILSKSAETPLWLASSNGWVVTAAKLIEHGAEINSKNNQSETPLIIASKIGHLTTVEHLVRHGANIGIRDSEGHSAVSWAVRKQHREIICLLLQNDARLRSLTGDIDQELLLAIEEEQYDVIHFMVQNGLNPNSKFKHDNPHEPRTLLAWAAARGHDSLLHLLINRGADLGLQDDIGWTALTKAAQFGREATMTLLLKHGANINYPHNDMLTPLQVVAERGDIRTAQYLIEKGADVNHKGMASRGPLASAARNAETDVMKLLIEKGALLNEVDYKGRTPLIRAAELGDKTVVETLLAYGAKCDVLDYSGQTGLMKAVACGHLDIAKLLAEHSGKDAAA